MHVSGAARTNFKRYFLKQGLSLSAAIVEAAREALADAGVEPAAVRAGVGGTFAAGLYA